MFAKRKLTVAQKIETLIGKETKLNGILESKGSIRIDGSFQGDINAQSDVIIGPEALVQARINCINVILAGRVEGNIITQGKLEIHSTGVLIGDAEVGALSVEDGAVLAGRCNMQIQESKCRSDGKGAEVSKQEVQEADRDINNGETGNQKGKQASEPAKHHLPPERGRGKKR